MTTSDSLWQADGRIIGIPSFPDTRRVLLCGHGIPTRVLASVGLTHAVDDSDAEIEKAISAVSAGADIITDHSVAGDIPEFHKRLVASIPAPLSYLTIYELMARHQRELRRLDAHEALDLVEEQISRGITLLTVHATATLEAATRHCESRRQIVSTSRGGAMLASVLLRSQEENVYWEHFDEILALAQRYHIALSLGSTYRPASVCDAGPDDVLYWEEIGRMSALVRRAITAQVPIMVEGIGHAPLNAVPDIVRRSKAMCYGVPYRVLTVATDIALGHDHIAGAVGIAAASMSGADLATCVTRSEHIGRPSREEIVEAVIAARVAAHCGDIAKFGDLSEDAAMSAARVRYGCRGLVENAIHPESALAALRAHPRLRERDSKQCTMCGEACALKEDVNSARRD